MKYKILLIKPDGITPLKLLAIPLGLLYLSSYLKKSIVNKVDIEFLDLRLLRNKKRGLTKKLLEYKPDLVGISTMTFEKTYLPGIVETIKEHLPEAKIVMGGPFITTNYEATLQEIDFHCAVIGEGEVVFENLVRKFIKGKDIKDTKGIAYLEKGKVIFNGREDFIKDLDSIPTPDYSLLNIKSYWKFQYQINAVLSEKRHMPISTSRACPFNCIYCHNIFGKKFRKRSMDNLFEEIKMLHYDFGAQEIHFIDDIFNVDRKWMHAILNKIIENKMNIKIAFPNGIRMDILEEEDIDLMKKAGVYSISCAIESGSKRIQKFIRKNLDIEKSLRNIDYAKKVGVFTRGFFMLGFPGETIEEMKESGEVAMKSNLTLVHFFDVVPFVGTELYKIVKEMYPDYDPTFGGSFFGDETFYGSVTGFDVKRLQRDLYFEFYLNWKRIKNILSHIHSFKTFYLNLIMFFILISELIKNKIRKIMRSKKHKKNIPN